VKDRARATILLTNGGSLRVVGDPVKIAHRLCALVDANLLLAVEEVMDVTVTHPRARNVTQTRQVFIAPRQVVGVIYSHRADGWTEVGSDGP
jgi:class 3 adenylate cyclase